MNEEPEGVWRPPLAIIAGLIVAIAGLVIWHEAAVFVLPKWWGRMAFFYMPLLIGAGVGGIMRLCRPEGTFGLAGLAAIITALAGLTGIGMQHWLSVNQRLQKLTDAAYEETIEFAKLTVPITDETKLRQVLTNSEIAVVGRIAAAQSKGNLREFWLWRSFIELHWLATRQLTEYGQGGADRTVWEATRVFEDAPFIDDLISTWAHAPAGDEVVANFQQMELPFLKQVMNGSFTREQFKSPLVTLTRERVSWISLPARGFDVFTGFFLALGCFVAYKLVRRVSEIELI